MNSLILFTNKSRLLLPMSPITTPLFDTNFSKHISSPGRMLGCWCNIKLLTNALNLI